MAREATVGAVIHERERFKVNDFTARFQRNLDDDGEPEPEFKPFVLTAGGGISTDALKLLKAVAGAGDVQAKRTVSARFGMILLKAAARMTRDRVPIVLR